MNDNGMPLAGRTLFTFDEERLAREWVEKVLSLEAKYQNELTMASDDEEKKKAIIKLIYDEVGPIPLPVKLSLSAGLPIVVEITKYQKEIEAESNSIINPDDIWTCPCCKSNNTGNFCPKCGSVRPK